MIWKRSRVFGGFEVEEVKSSKWQRNTMVGAMVGVIIS